MTNNQIHTSESQLQQRCAELEKDNARLRGVIQGTFASYGLMVYHRESSSSWPRDRFESWLDGAAEDAGIEIQGAAGKSKVWWRCLLNTALEQK